MKTIIKKIVIWLRLIEKPYVENPNKLLENSYDLTFKSFGNNHRDKIFYVIRQESRGRGLFSLLAGVICNLHIAESNGFIPVVDFKNFSTEYTDSEDIVKKNIWEQYFEKVSKYDLDEVYSSANVIFSSNGYPAGYPTDINEDENLKFIYERYINITKEIKTEVSKFTEENFKNAKVLGVHFRGQEFRKAAFHTLPPTQNQIINKIRDLIEKYKFEKIFVVTEDVIYLKCLIEEFGGMIIHSNSFRTKDKNAYRLPKDTRPNHKFKLGREILIDALLLANCKGLVGCTSNVIAFTRFIASKNMIIDERINNGKNSRNIIFARYKWLIKSKLPENFCGFKNNNKN